jgi:hypothetical protein
MSEFLYCILGSTKEFNRNKAKDLSNEPLNEFGRSGISSNMLNMDGMACLRRISGIIKSKYEDLNYCPLLPRIIQFFLWYVPEKSALNMALALLEQNFQEKDHEDSKTLQKFFITEPRHLKFAIRLIKAQIKKPIKITKNLIDELLNDIFITVVPFEVTYK